MYLALSMVYPGVQLVPFFLSLVCDLSQSGTASHNHTRRQRPCEEAAAGRRGQGTHVGVVHAGRISPCAPSLVHETWCGLSPVPDGEKTTGLGRLGARGMSWPLAGVAEATPCREQCPPWLPVLCIASSVSKCRS